jgi:hypothetical protein
MARPSILQLMLNENTGGKEHGHGDRSLRDRPLHLGRGYAHRPDTLMQTGKTEALKLLADGAGHTFSAGTQEHVQGKPSHRRRGVELLGDRHEGGTLSIQGLNDAGEVHQGSCQPVDLVNHDHVNQSPAHVGQQSL